MIEWKIGDFIRDRGIVLGGERLFMNDIGVIESYDEYKIRIKWIFPKSVKDYIPSSYHRNDFGKRFEKITEKEVVLEVL